MTTNQIKARLILQAGSIKAAAEAISEDPKAVSATINYYRVNDRIRKKLSRHFKLQFSENVPIRLYELRRAA